MHLPGRKGEDRKVSEASIFEKMWDCTYLPVEILVTGTVRRGAKIGEPDSGQETNRNFCNLRLFQVGMMSVLFCTNS